MSRYHVAGFLLLTYLSCTSAVFAAKATNQQCNQAFSEMNESADLLGVLQSRWITKELSVDYGEFIVWRKDYFNPKYNSIRDRYQLRNSGSSNPRINSNNSTFRLYQLVDEIQIFSKNGDKEALRSSWANIYKSFKEDIASIREKCPK